MQQAFVGIDVGTSSARAGIFNENGTLLASARHPITVWHEAVHGTVSRRQIVNDVIGVLGMLPYMTPYFMQRWGPARLIMTMDNKIMYPTSFSPIRTLPVAIADTNTAFAEESRN